MNFAQTLNTGTRQQWLSDCGDYRIDYYNTFPHLNNHRDEKGNFAGYRPAYYASVRLQNGDRTVWAFAHKHGKFPSFKGAERACKSNRSKWRRFLKAKNAEEARELIEQSVVGLKRKKGRRPVSTHQTTRILASVPAWVEEIIPRRLRRLLPGANPPRKRKACHNLRNCDGRSRTSESNTASMSFGHTKRRSRITARSSKRTGTTLIPCDRSRRKRKSSVDRTRFKPPSVG